MRKSTKLGFVVGSFCFVVGLFVPGLAGLIIHFVSGVIIGSILANEYLDRRK